MKKKKGFFLCATTIQYTMRAVDKPVVILTEKRRVKPTTRLKEAMTELTPHEQRRRPDEEEEEGVVAGERLGMRSRKKTKLEDQDAVTEASTKNMAEERAERNVLAAAAAAMTALSTEHVAGQSVKEEKEKTDPELVDEVLVLLREPSPGLGVKLSGEKMYEQAERERRLRQAMEEEVYVVAEGPAPRVVQVEYSVRPTDPRNQMDFVCQMTEARGLVQLTKQQVLEHPEGLDLLLNFYEKHIVISAKLNIAKEKKANQP